MKLIVVLAIVILCACAGCFFAKKAYSLPIRIDFKVSTYEWTIPVIFAFFSMTIVMAFEWSFNIWLLKKTAESSVGMILVSKFVDGGALVPVLTAFISFLTKEIIESFSLDLAKEYNGSAVKIIFTCSIIVNIIMYGLIVFPKALIFIKDPIIGNYFSRLILWILVAIGSWFGIGFHCEGRVARGKSEKINIGKFFSYYWMPCFIASAFMTVEYIAISIIPDKITKVNNCIITVVLSFLISAIIYLAIVNAKQNPGKKARERMLRKAVNKYRNDKHSTGYYRRINYEIVDGKLIIHKRDVIYKNHDDDILKIYGKKEIEIDADSLEIDELIARISRELNNRADLQEEYLKKEVENSKDSVRKNLINSHD